MCGNSGIFHGTILKPKIGHYTGPSAGDPAVDPQVAIDQQAALAAADAAAAWRNRRLRSTLQAASQGVIGSPSVLGGAASGPGGGGGGSGRPGTGPGRASIMGANY
jgi:hypothetical protein